MDCITSIIVGSTHSCLHNNICVLDVRYRLHALTNSPTIPYKCSDQIRQVALTHSWTCDARRHEHGFWENPTAETVECYKCGRQIMRTDKLRVHSAKCNGPAPPPAK
ncbi:hypothetical protein PR048_031040 [Dryococelus australis]|uniref:C2H2-type domain-containing protein n=1 Tax=Dryococelus australis TaxID=614101 RepID=A0ABQ9G8A4_9NEOP|nr:hypothetical protein PR048_031040 [Dryococelus australis]